PGAYWAPRLAGVALGQPATQAGVALLGRQRLGVGARRAVAARRAHALSDPLDEALLVELLGPALDLVQVFAQRRELLGDILVGAEVRDREAARPQGFDRRQRVAPGIEVDVGRRRGREHDPAVDPHAGDVAREDPPRRLVQVGDVVRGVAGGMGDLEGP